MMTSNATAIAYGEVLWDLLPDGALPGGAPMNVAYHLQQWGVKAGMISRIGTDEWGQQLLDFLNNKKIDTHLLQTDEQLSTGVVQVDLDERGHASYDIVEPVAWDNIHSEAAAKTAVKNADALVFGSLACRNSRSRDTLMELIQESSFNVFDVNLRPPHYTKELIETLLQRSQLVKMNDDELKIISAWYSEAEHEIDQMQAIQDQFQLQGLVVTKGGDGASMLHASGYYRQGGFPAKVKDTIGSGDSFLAGFLSKHLLQKDIQECLEFACKLGAFIATQKGATPDYSSEQV
jgi:fructokinase